MARDTAWQLTREGWERHVAGYTHPLAVEGAARKYGMRLGPLFVDLLARRLREVSVDRDGARLDLACAWRRCDAWAHEGQTATEHEAAARDRGTEEGRGDGGAACQWTGSPVDAEALLACPTCRREWRACACVDEAPSDDTLLDAAAGVAAGEWWR